MSTARPHVIEADLNDEELMRQLAAGDVDALGLLHRRYAPFIFNLAAQTLDRAAAEEITQDVFVVIWRKADTFDPARGAFRPWVLRIAHMRILNELRRRHRRPQVVPDPEGLRLVTLPDDTPAPEETAWRDYRRETLQEAVGHLPAPQQQALSLAFFDELTHEQVAAFLNVPLGTAKTRIRTGLQKLRLYLTPLLVAVLALTALFTAVGIGVHQQQEEQARTNRALNLVADSTTGEVHLAAAPGLPPATHGSYHSKPGTTTAVLEFSHVAPAPAGQTYQAWVHYDGNWHSLGVVHPDGDGHGILIAEGAYVATPPDAVQLTLEPSRGSPQPSGPVVISWSGP